MAREIGYYDIDGMPISMRRWAILFEKFGNKRVAFTRLWGETVVEISTVWLGLDHNWGEGPPLIFETMVFGGPRDQMMMRYATKEQAVEGHNRVVSELMQEMGEVEVDEREVL